MLSASAAGLMAAVAETLAKLLMHQRTWLRHYPQHSLPANAAGQPSSSAGEKPHGSAADAAAAAQPVQLPPDSQQGQARLLQSALALLLQLQFHPATASLTEVCQRLSVFFDVFSAASEANQLQLAAACLPAARQALHLKTKRHPTPLLAKYVLQLLQQARLRQEQQAAAGDGSKPTRSGRRAWCLPLHCLCSMVSNLPHCTSNNASQCACAQCPASSYAPQACCKVTVLTASVVPRPSVRLPAACRHCCQPAGRVVHLSGPHAAGGGGNRVALHCGSWQAAGTVQTIPVIPAQGVRTASLTDSLNSVKPA